MRRRTLLAAAVVLVYEQWVLFQAGIDGAALRNFMEQAQAGIGGILSMFTGGALGRMGVFALGIMPYISASIIVQLLASMVPSLEQLKKEGEQGRKKINQYTRYGTVLLALFQAYGLAVSLEAGGMAHEPGWFFRAAVVIYSAVFSFLVLPRGLALNPGAVITIYTIAATGFAVICAAGWWWYRRFGRRSLN